MAWFDRKALGQERTEALATHLGLRHPRVLAWADADDGFAAGLPDRLVIRRGEEWIDVPWADIVHGGWEPERGRFTWTRYDGTSDHIIVTAEHRLPELFRERVTASIAVHQPLDTKGARGVVIVARRNPADPHATLAWRVVAGDGIDVSAPDVARIVEPELARLRSEYEI